MSNEATSDCLSFVGLVGNTFQDLFNRYGLVFCDCDCQRDGRECVALYRNAQHRVLLQLSDGDFAMLIGDATASFPGPYYVDRAGADGWYAMFLLVELLGGHRVWTPKRVKQFWRGELDQYRFEAELFAEWADRLLLLFEPDHDQSWREEFHRRFHV